MGLYSGEYRRGWELIRKTFAGLIFRKGNSFELQINFHMNIKLFILVLRYHEEREGDGR